MNMVSDWRHWRWAPVQRHRHLNSWNNNENAVKKPFRVSSICFSWKSTFGRFIFIAMLAVLTKIKFLCQCPVMLLLFCSTSTFQSRPGHMRALLGIAWKEQSQSSYIPHDAAHCHNCTHYKELELIEFNVQILRRRITHVQFMIYPPATPVDQAEASMIFDQTKYLQMLQLSSEIGRASCRERV